MTVRANLPTDHAAWIPSWVSISLVEREGESRSTGAVLLVVSVCLVSVGFDSIPAMVVFRTHGRQPLPYRIMEGLPVVPQLQRTADARGNRWLRLNSIAYSTSVGTPGAQAGVASSHWLSVNGR
jgi:hypothetical protein